MRKSLRSGTMSPSGDMQVIRGSSTLRIETIAGDRLQEQLVEGLPEVSFGRGMGGRGGTYITQDGAILTLSADIQGIIDDPSIQLGVSARSLVCFEAFAQLLVADAAGQYHIIDTVSLGEQKSGSYGEFLSSGLLTLQNPNGRVTRVSIQGQTLSVDQINSPQGSRVVSLPNELLVVQGDDLSRWSLEKASQFENADVVFADFDPYDVNEDGYVTALDALVVINLLNRGVGQSEPLPTLLSLVPSADTNGDGVVSALDALRIINRLNESDQVLPAGEIFSASDVVFQQMRHDRTTDNDVTSILAQNEPLLF